MLTSPGFKKNLPSLGKFGVWLGVSAIAGHLGAGVELPAALAAIGVNKINLDAACDLVKNLAVERLSGHYENFRSGAGFGLNHDLQNAIQEGIKNALKELKVEFLKSHKLPEKDREQIAPYFSSLAYQLGQLITSDAQVDKYVLERESFLFDLIETVHAEETIYEIDLLETTEVNLKAFLRQNLKAFVYRYVNEEFKSDEKAKSAYFIHLLEYGARTNQKNQEQLLE